MLEDTGQNRRATDHDLLIRVDEKLERVITDLGDLKDDTKAQINDHENRLDALEKWRWYAVGLATIVAFVAEILLRKYV